MNILNYFMNCNEKKQECFTFSLEDVFFEKTTGGIKLTPQLFKG